MDEMPCARVDITRLLEISAEELDMILSEQPEPEGTTQ